MNKQLTISISLLLSIFSFSLQAQNNFLPGHIITVDGDSLSGLIDYQNWDKNPDIISFKLTTDLLERKYTTSDLKSFEVSGDRFISAKTKIETSWRSMNNLDNDGKLKFENIHSFLQVLYAGIKPLYIYKDDKGNESFFIDLEGQVQLLEYKIYTIEKSGKQFKSEINNYKTQLRKYLSNCDDIKNRITSLKYSKSNLVSAFDSYYNCVKLNPSFKKELEKTKIDIGIVSGISKTNFNFNGTAFSDLVKSDLEENFSITGGGFIEFTPARNRGKRYFRSELLYSYYKTEPISSSSISTQVSKNNFDFAYLKLNSLLGYKFLIGNSHLNLNLGLSFGYAIKANTEAFNDPKRTEVGLLFGLGYGVTKYNIDLRYEQGNGMSSFSNLSSNVDRISILFSYKL